MDEIEQCGPARTAERVSAQVTRMRISGGLSRAADAYAKEEVEVVE